jgi:MscS family membrane protein
MKKILLLMLIGVQLLAADTFWQQLVETEQRFYAHPAETNATAEEADTVDAKFEAFAALVSALKSDPYAVENPDNPFFHPARADERLYKLNAKIRINRERGYTLAEARDTVAVETLKLRQRIYVFFASLAADWTNLEEAGLKTLLDNEMAALQKVDLDGYEQNALALSEANEEASKELLENLAQLKMHHAFFKEILGYLQLNPQSLRYRTLLQQMELGSLINAINDNAAASQVNTALRYVNLDLGRLSLFLGILLLAWLVAAFLFFPVYRLLYRLINRKKDAYDELLLNNIENIRRPLFILILAFGLELGLEVLHHPRTSEEQSTVFYFVYLVTFSYILMILVDNFFYHFLLQRARQKNQKMRSELVNLILSIAKIVIIITAALFFLVHIGVNITGLVASLGIGGLAVALAAKDTLSNFFGLLKILSDNSFSQGDWIAAGDVEGTVVEIGFISTDVRTFDNALITVPNEKLANVPLKNYSRRKVGRRIKMHIGVTYGSDREALAKAIKAIEKMLREHAGTVVPGEYDTELRARLKRKEKRLISVEDKFGIKTSLMVYLDQLSASSMDILIYTFTNTVDWEEWLGIKQDIIFRIWEILENHGLEFAFPSQSLYFDKDNLGEAVAPVLKKPADS